MTGVMPTSGAGFAEGEDRAAFPEAGRLVNGGHSGSVHPSTREIRS